MDSAVGPKDQEERLQECNVRVLTAAHLHVPVFVVASKSGRLVFLAVQENPRVIQLSSASQVSIHLRATCGSPSQQHCLPEVNLPNNLHSDATLQLCHAELATLRQDWAVPSLPLSLQTNAVVKQYFHCNC